MHSKPDDDRHIFSGVLTPVIGCSTPVMSSIDKLGTACSRAPGKSNDNPGVDGRSLLSIQLQLGDHSS